MFAVLQIIKCPGTGHGLQGRIKCQEYKLGPECQCGQAGSACGSLQLHFGECAKTEKLESQTCQTKWHQVTACRPTCHQDQSSPHASGSGLSLSLSPGMKETPCFATNLCSGLQSLTSCWGSADASEDLVRKLLCSETFGSFIPDMLLHSVLPSASSRTPSFYVTV